MSVCCLLVLLHKALHIHGWCGVRKAPPPPGGVESVILVGTLRGCGGVEKNDGAGNKVMKRRDDDKGKGVGPKSASFGWRQEIP